MADTDPKTEAEEERDVTMEDVEALNDSYERLRSLMLMQDVIDDIDNRDKHDSRDTRSVEADTRSLIESELLTLSRLIDSIEDRVEQ